MLIKLYTYFLKIRLLTVTDTKLKVIMDYVLFYFFPLLKKKAQEQTIKYNFLTKKTLHPLPHPKVKKSILLSFNCNHRTKLF